MADLWAAVISWKAYGFIGVVLSALSLVFAFLASTRSKSAKLAANQAVALVSAFDAVDVLGRVMENLRNARHEVKSKDWRRVCENLEAAKDDVIRLLATNKLSLEKWAKENLEEVLDTIRQLAKDSDAADVGKAEMDALKSRAQFESILHLLLILQEHMKGRQHHE